MLTAAGVSFSVQPSTIDEARLKRGLGDPPTVALELAKAKALDVSAARPDDWVIGSDSVVAVEGRQFDKPASRQEAADHLGFFSGKTIELTSAVALAHGGSIDCVHGETARLHVRELSDAFIAGYLDQEWPEVGYCVGVFRIEALGVQLFDRIEGNHFTILGMPLMPLLGWFRMRGLIPS